MFMRWLKEMSSWWLNILVVITFSTLVNSKFDLKSSIELARCRASCLQKMQTPIITDRECRRSFNCSQCWEACVFVKVGGRLCATTDCGLGCLEACPGSYTLSASHLKPLPLEEALIVNDSRVSWPPVSGPVAVYVVMADGSELCQTLEASADLSSVVDSATVRVLVVNWRGLVKALGPVAASPVDQALNILRSIGMVEKMGLVLDSNSQYDEHFINSSQVPARKVWRLKVESIDYQLPLVLTKISWCHHHQLLTNNQVTMKYLVTWLEYGSLVRGNLLTNTSTVTLSLLPDTVYTIQVSVLNLRSPKLQSELLEINTQNLSKPSSSLSSLHRKFESSETFIIAHKIGFKEQDERLEEIIAIVIVLLGLVVFSAWRWRNCQTLQESKLLDERIDFPGLATVLPPTRRICSDPKQTKADFSSTEHLLHTTHVSK